MAYTLLFLLKKKMWFAKATHIFFSKNTCELDILLTRTVNILTTNELVKLTMLWTTGPWLLFLNHYTLCRNNTQRYMYSDIQCVKNIVDESKYLDFVSIYYQGSRVLLHCPGTCTAFDPTEPHLGLELV